MATEPCDSQIEDSIRSFVAGNLVYSDAGFTYGDDASFLQEGIIDSLGVMELVAFVQSTFGVNVDQQEVTTDHFDSVARLAAFIRRKQAEAPPSAPVASAQLS